jgi:hypothetical protein
VKSIDEYKKEILLEIMNGEEVSWYYTQTLPKDDELRTFLCELGSWYAYKYADFVDKCPHEDTRKSAYKDSRWKSAYIMKFGE